MRVRALFLSLLGVLLFALPILSQDRYGQWMDAQPLLIMPSGDNGTYPQAVTGPSGHTHLVFFGRPEDDRSGTISLYYTRWNVDRWLPNQDVLINPDDGSVPEMVAAVEDNAGYLHVLWSGSRLWHSQALIAEAGDYRGWTKPVGVFDQARVNYVDAKIDSADRLHMALTTSARDVFYVAMDPDGTVETPFLIRSVQTFFPYYVSLALTRSGNLMTCWVEVNGAGDGRSRGVYCAGTRDGGLTWSAPEEVASGHYWGGITYFTETNMLARIIGGGNGVGGRSIQFSEDDGLTWLPPVDLTQGVDMQGLNNHMAAMDSTQSIHVLVNPGNAQHVQSVYAQGSWLPNRQTGWQGWDWIDFEVANGNTLIAAWWRDNTIFASWASVDAPYLAPQPLEAVAASAALMLPTPTIVASATEPSPTPVPVAPQPIQLAPSAANRPFSQATVLILSIGPALLLVIGVAILRVARLRR